MRRFKKTLSANNYQKKIHMYKERGITTKLQKSKIKTWKKAIARIYKREDAINFLIDKIKEYFGFNPFYRENRTARKSDKWLARMCAGKYLVENLPFSSTYIARYFKYHYNYFTDNRRSFTKSFTNNPKNYEKWNDFRNYMKINSDVYKNRDILT